MTWLNFFFCMKAGNQSRIKSLDQNFFKNVLEKERNLHKKRMDILKSESYAGERIISQTSLIKKRIQWKR